MVAVAEPDGSGSCPVVPAVSRLGVETTALHLAAEGAMLTLLGLFLERGGNPNTRSSR
jgi:hypothetical protein